ncbi:hypothetical protein BURMUCGD1_3368 [Burkholderia multivorans CGD1]|nr:hypothetical protein BURMUCGD1_3368 [Burkholderia multivorans CGD1]
MASRACFVRFPVNITCSFERRGGPFRHDPRLLFFPLPP